MAQVGRISGPLLEANLERNGKNLSFRNDLDTTQLLLLDVVNGKLAVNYATPSRELEIAGTTRSTNYLSTDSTLADIIFDNNEIKNISGNINFNATTAIVSPNIETDNIRITDNTISTHRSNANLELRPWRDYQLVNGDPYTTELLAGLTAASSGGSHTYKAFWEVVLPSGFQRGDINESGGIDIDDVMAFLSVARGITTSGSTYDRSVAAIEASLPTLEVKSNLNVDGAINATGNITMDGNITIGDNQAQDTVDFNAEFISNIEPDVTYTYNIGSYNDRWLRLDTNLVNGQKVIAGNYIAGGVDIAQRQGNIFYVSVNGTNTNSGEHPQSPFKTIKHALDAVDASSAGPVTIHVYPGDYEEQLPLTVPSNVTIQGHDLRNTVIRPDTSSQSEDVFLLNGETTIKQLTIKDFYYDSGNNKGHAFRFANNAVITTRSPYIQDVTVITQGTTTSASDPRGFASGDAGKGALIDGAVVPASSNEASMLFHAATFITPGVDAITMTNGVRVEWLNSFTYFANRGLYAVRGSTGHQSPDGSTINYGAEIRSIGSANVYGNKGAVADGAGTLMYLINHNFAYIGVGKFVDNDPSRSIQANEVEELNSGKVYFSSTDHLGNFRVGDSFLVDQESGETTLNLSEAEIDSFGGLNITTSGALTVVNGNLVETGNIRLQGNQILSTANDINIVASGSNNINFLTSLNITNNLDITGNLTGAGNLKLGDESVDTVTFNDPFDQNIKPAVSGTFDLGSPTLRWKNAFLSQAEISDIKIFDNVIQTNVSNADLELRANGTGKILVPNNNVTFSNNLTVNGTTNLQGLSTTGNIVHSGNLQLTGNFDVTGNLSATQNLTVNSDVSFQEFNITGNLIETTLSDADLDLRANGTGDVVFNDSATFNALTITQHSDLIDVDVTSSVQATDFTTDQILVRENFIETRFSNADLDLRATGNIVIQENTTAEQNLTVNGTTTLKNTGITGTLTHVGNTTQTGNRNITGNTTITKNLDVTGSAQLEEILIDDNYITTTTSNADLELRASGSGNIIVPSNDVVISKDLAVDDLVLQSQLTVNNLTGNNLSINTFNITGDFQFENINISDNVIQTTLSNSDLELQANGSGNLNFQENVVVNNNLSADNLTGVQNINITSGVTFDQFTGSSNINFFDNVIQTTVSNSNLELRTSGAGTVKLDDFDFTSSVIANNGSNNIQFTPGSNNLNISATGSLKLPAGATASGSQGQIRYNTTTNSFEGFDPNNIHFGGVFSSNRLTNLVADTNNNIIGTVNNSVKLTINAQGVETTQLQTEDININSTTIRTNVSNSDLVLNPSGVGIVKMGNINISDNTIDNTTSGAALLQTTGTGYVKYDGQKGFVLPRGTTANRPASPAAGETRFNTDTTSVEIYTGSDWVIATGTGAVQTRVGNENLAFALSLALG